MDSELLEKMYICEGGKLPCKWWYDPPGKCRKPSDAACPIGDVPNPHQQDVAETDSILG